MISELEEKLNPDTLIETAQKGEYEWPIIQRLGYLLSLEEEVCGHEALLEPLAKKPNIHLSLSLGQHNSKNNGSRADTKVYRRFSTRL